MKIYDYDEPTFNAPLIEDGSDNPAPAGKYISLEDHQRILAEKDSEIERLKTRVEQRDKQIGAFNSGGFADADALAEKYLDTVAERDELRATVERLKAPVSDQESAKMRSSYENCVKGTIEHSLRRVTNELLASRSVPQEGQK